MRSKPLFGRGVICPSDTYSRWVRKWQSGCCNVHSDQAVLTCVVVPGSNLLWDDCSERLRESKGAGLMASSWCLGEVPVRVQHEATTFWPELLPESMSLSGFITPALCVLPNPLFSIHKEHRTDHQPKGLQSHNSAQSWHKTTAHNTGLCPVAHSHCGPQGQPVPQPCY